MAAAMVGSTAGADETPAPSAAQLSIGLADPRAAPVGIAAGHPEETVQDRPLQKAGCLENSCIESPTAVDESGLGLGALAPVLSGVAHRGDPERQLRVITRHDRQRVGFATGVLRPELRAHAQAHDHGGGPFGDVQRRAVDMPLAHEAEAGCGSSRSLSR